MSSLASERVALLGAIDPDAYAASTVVSDYGYAGNFERMMAVVSVGDMVATSVVSAKLVQATTSAGAGAKDITGKSITNLTQAGTDDNKQAIINVKSDELDTTNGFDYVALSVTLATAGADAAGYLFGIDARYGPASDNDLASVDEIVS